MCWFCGAVLTSVASLYWATVYRVCLLRTLSAGRFVAGGLSSAALRHNRAFAASFEAASLDCVEAPRPTLSSRRASTKIQQMTPMDVEQISSRLAAVRRNHLQFLSGEVPSQEEAEPAPVKIKHARPAAMSAESHELTRSQRMAQRRFYDIDMGKLDAQSVFETVAAIPDRVTTKLNFFRDRLDLVLPAIEERFVVRDEKRDCEMLDLPRLRNGVKQSARTPRKKLQANPSSGSLHEFSDAAHMEEAGDDSPTSPCLLDIEPRTLQHVMSMDSVQTRPSENSSLETGEQRSLRIVRAARVRDERIQVAQETVRSKELEWRLRHLKSFQGKAQRKDLSLHLAVQLAWLRFLVSLLGLGSCPWSAKHPATWSHVRLVPK